MLTLCILITSFETATESLLSDETVYLSARSPNDIRRKSKDGYAYALCKAMLLFLKLPTPDTVTSLMSIKERFCPSEKLSRGSITFPLNPPRDSLPFIGTVLPDSSGLLK